MKPVIKNVIQSGRFELTDILSKIDTLWIQGSLASDDRDELARLAREKATPEMGYASQAVQLADHEKRLKALEERLGLSSDDSTDTEYPPWKQPTGAHDAYYTDAKMTYTDGLRYICIAPEGYAVSYGPDVLPGMWKLAE